MRLHPPLMVRVGRYTIGKYTKDYSNLPDRYIKRAMEQIEYKTPNELNYLKRVIKKEQFAFPVERPWTQEFRQYNQKDRPHVWVEPIKDWSFFRGDRVEVLTGKDKGKQGIVMMIIQERNWVLVEGLNCTYKTIGKRPDFPGAMTRWEEPLLVTTEVSLIDPSDNKPTKIEWRYTEQGERVRVSVRTGRIVPVPVTAEATIDYKAKSAYPEQPKDTVSDELTKITFQPKLRTFEMDIMEEHGIKETRTPLRTYFY